MGNPALEEWHITSVGGLANGFLIVLGVAAIAALIWTWYSLDPQLSLKARVGVVFLRALGLGMALAFLFQPNLTRRILKQVPTSFAVLVDVSGSMTRGGDGSRLARAREILATNDSALRKLAREHTLEWYCFAEGSESVAGPATLGACSLEGTGTGIGDALTALAPAGEERRPSGILLISDGADTERTGDAEDLSWAKDLNIPINTLPIVTSGRERDLAITTVKVDRFAFSRSDTPIVVGVKAIGFEDDEVEVSLWQSGAMVRQEKAVLLGGEGQVTFSVQPFRTGRQVITVSVPIPEGDEIPQNNTVHTEFDVIRDRFRILHLAGKPSWDQRFLRETMEGWPRVDLVSFYVLRTPYQSSTLGSSGLALIPFPTAQLFENHLDEFDVVIIQDLEPGEVGLDSYLERIATWVEGGGGLVLMGGTRTFGPSAMGLEPFSKVLPVGILPNGTPMDRIADEAPFRPQLTEAGRRHPLTMLARDEDENDNLWKSIPRLDGIMRTARVSEGAVTLAGHPTYRVDDGLAPLIAVREAGKGRSLAITTDSLWRWRFTGPMEGSTTDTYKDFWHRAVAWLTRDPDLDRLRMKVEPASVRLGDPVFVELEQLNETYQPSAGSSLECEITWLDSEGIEQSDRKEIRLDETGRFRFEWEPRVAGPHSVKALASDGTEATQQFLALQRNVEDQHLEPDEAYLEALSSATGGRNISATSPDLSALSVGKAAGEEILSREDLSLWDRWWALAAIILAFLGEWMLRRKLGLN